MQRSRAADQEVMRKVNQSLILTTLRLKAPISRAELATLTGLNRSTVSNIVKSLMDEGLVWEQEIKGSRIGRPSISLNLRPDSGAIIGVEINVDFIFVLLTDFVANCLYQDFISFDRALPQIEVLLKAEQAVELALEQAAQRQLRVLGIGVGLPGLVDVDHGQLIFAPNLGWRDIPLRLMWNQRFRCPIYVDNEANLAAMGEYYFGVAHNISHFVYLSSGVGMGGGIMINGKLFRGWNGFAGELGHMQRDRAGQLCGCGRRGCWETQVGPQAILNRVKNALLESGQPEPAGASLITWNGLTFPQVVELALQGDPICRRAFEETAVDLGNGIADIANIFNPELVVIGGLLCQAREILHPVIERTVQVETLPPSLKGLRIAFSERGQDACAYGAVAIVLDNILQELAII